MSSCRRSTACRSAATLSLIHIYYSKNFVRYITPKVLLRNRLQKVLAELEKRPDKEYILRRVDYYNKMQGIVPIDPVSSHRLADHKFGDAGSVYFFDSYEFTRWFSDSLYWNYVFGDVTQVPGVPSIVKSRPIQMCIRDRV